MSDGLGTAVGMGVPSQKGAPFGERRMNDECERSL